MSGLQSGRALTGPHFGKSMRVLTGRPNRTGSLVVLVESPMQFRPLRYGGRA